MSAAKIWLSALLFFSAGFIVTMVLWLLGIAFESPILVRYCIMLMPVATISSGIYIKFCRKKMTDGNELPINNSIFICTNATLLNVFAYMFIISGIILMLMIIFI